MDTILYCGLFFVLGALADCFIFLPIGSFFFRLVKKHIDKKEK